MSNFYIFYHLYLGIVNRAETKTFIYKRNAFCYNMVSAFRESILFFEKLGVYDVVLPFLLVFSIIFAILEKTKVLGLEKKKEYKNGEWVESLPITRKSLNAMVSFVIAFLVVASTKLVAVINKALADTVLLLLLSFCFLFLVGSFSKEQEEAFYLEKGWATAMKIVMAAGIVLIFLNALGWLGNWYNWLIAHWNSTSVLSIVLVLITLIAIVFVTGQGGSTPQAKSNKEGE
jgi:hypothetical protein